MIAHQTKGEEPHVAALARLLQKPEKCLEIPILVEDRSPPVSPIEDMITITSWGTPGSAWHGENYAIKTDCPQELIYDVAFSDSLLFLMSP
jgi:hypothetical protein